ncbi:hypothetical protein PZ897_02025 [Hoeflea sp. YIM 152468]|uniref:DUF6950 family protein n=1 Tax=Hoeflea sp. YIM 152468 TaxID=3031759 RepID=UPI0023DAC7FC|nr:hypothetical protein [Hoeflea sp. YIM 152468]MDF1606948.1 hypothetical protein [Hoeflea sp. YIM 152468]
MRIDGWEKCLKAIVERHRDLPGQWGVSDCWMLAVEAHEAVTGKKLAPKLRRYKTEKAGYKLFAKHGFTTVGEALAAHLPECPALMAQRGDLGLIERGGLESCGVVTSLGLAVKTLYDDGSSVLEYHPVTAMTRAFKVT